MGSDLLVNAGEGNYFKQLAWRADRWAISSESELALEIFAYLASDGTRSYADVLIDVGADRLKRYDPLYLARLFRIVAVRPSLAHHHAAALSALLFAVPRIPRISATTPLRTLLFELLYWDEQFGEAEALLTDDPDLQQLYYGYMDADLSNPFARPEATGTSDWLQKFNAPFREHGLSQITLEESELLPFDNLSTEDARCELFDRNIVGSNGSTPGDDPLVTIILTTYNPVPTELRTSVASILNQSWQNIELLVVDDCSTNVASGLFEALEKCDPRVRVVRMPQNGGTYLARNAGIRASSGSFITGQDTDDWSHPQRIERQLSALFDREDLAGVIATANRTDERLVRTAVGFMPQRRCEVSLMFRREDAIAMGGYLPMRKGADSEFRERLVKHCGRRVEELSDPLYLTRLSHGSLSRADFRHGWTAPARLAFSSAYRFWHAQPGSHLSSFSEGFSEGASEEFPFVAPRRISGASEEGGLINVCMVADWRASGSIERAAVDEVGALLELDITVGVLQLDSPFNIGVSPRALNPKIQEWINLGLVTQLMPDEEREVDLMIIRDPAVVDYARSEATALSARQIRLVAVGQPHLRDDDRRMYDPHRSERAVRRLFGTMALWAMPQGEDPLAYATHFNVNPAARQYPLVVSENAFTRQRVRSSDAVPIIGRGAINQEFDWPDSGSISDVYPIDGSVDFRVLGDARAGIRVLGERRLPPSWIDFPSHEYAAPNFWRAVDIMVHFDRETTATGFDRTIIEALATGTPVVCSQRYGELFGSAVCAVSEANASSTLRTILQDEDKYGDLAKGGVIFAREHFPPEAYRSYILHLLGETPDSKV